MKISVKTPVLNGESFLKQTIGCVLSKVGDFEIGYIIKDDGLKYSANTEYCL